MAKLGQGKVRQGMDDGVANFITLPTGWQNWCRVEKGKVWLRALLVKVLCPRDGRTEARYSEAMYDRGRC